MIRLDVAEVGEQGQVRETRRREVPRRRPEARLPRRRLNGELPIRPEPVGRAGLVVRLDDDVLVRELSLEMDRLAGRRSESAGQWPPVRPVRMNGPDPPPLVAAQPLRF